MLYLFRYRREIVSLNDIWRSDSPQIALIFEGGAFIYPGIELGYERNVDLDGFPVDIIVNMFVFFLIRVGDTCDVVYEAACL